MRRRISAKYSQDYIKELYYSAGNCYEIEGNVPEALRMYEMKEAEFPEEEQIREIAQVFAAIADIIEQKILPADWRCVDAGNEENGAQPDGNPA